MYRLPLPSRADAVGRIPEGDSPEAVVVAVADKGELNSINAPCPMPRRGTLLTIVPELSRRVSQPSRRPT